ncbi:oligosaccharyl transferase subunit ost3/OST6 [Geranomyces michiganensis]|nr:oligosaccharyl transferase subunit ost3/OST6 [Geranomyces michiganensis]
MRFANLATQGLLAALLLLLGLALSPSAQASAASSVQKVGRLESKLSASKAIRLTGHDFDYLTDSPRNFSLFVALTALAPEMGCVPCREYEKEFNAVASSWQHAGEKRRLYFAQLDFADGREVFQKLQIQSVPIVLHFPPTEGPHAVAISGAYEPYDLNRWGLTADALAKYASDACKVNFTIRRPFDWSKLGTRALLVLCALACVRLAWQHIATVITSRKLWTVALIAWSVLMCSGFMWNRIRGPPYTGMRDNKPEIVAPGFQNQFILETQIVGILYAAISITFVLIVTRIPQLSDPTQQRTATYALVIVFMLLYSTMLKFFKLKNSAYPYQMLL